MNDCILTVYCLAYNHEKYIRKTLEGFVNQKTTYRYKVIVHDDASQDRTADIIREYAERYPDIIHPIYQTENQYSKHVQIVSTYIVPRLEGKYIAICEGDDYWCDSQKLQLQLDYMESHPECSLCVHNTERIFEDGTSTGKFSNPLVEDTDFSAEQIIESGSGALFHYSSCLYRKQFRLEKPEEFTIKRAGDYPMAIWLATRGTVHYFGRVMSKYRVMSAYSWSKRMAESREAREKHTENAISSLSWMDEYTDHKYTRAFQFAIKRYKVSLMSKPRLLWSAITDAGYRKIIFEKLLKRLRSRKCKY